jgi:penicillin-binding protein 2
MALAGDRPRSSGTPSSGRRGFRIGRIYWVVLTFSLFFVAYGFRLYDLQIRRYSSFKAASQENYVKDETVRALRGNIYSRDGVLLAKNRLAVDLIYKLVKGKSQPIVGWERIRYLAQIADPKPPVINHQKESEIALARNLPEDSIAALEEMTVLQSGLELRRRIQREYPQGALAGNLIGYTAEANEEQVEAKTYELGDTVGVSGLESSLERYLRGQNGVSQLEVDAKGRRISERIVREGRAGQDVYLTLDSKLQKAGRVRYGLPLERQVKGAIVALDPRNGEVLALATAPALNPNWFSQSPRPPELVKALTGESGALLNRAVSGYTPGSVYKPTSTNAFLETYGNRYFSCSTGLRYGGRLWRNWAKRDYGMLDGRGAIAQSCNTWYYQSSFYGAGVLPYAEKLAARARELGFGAETGLELNENLGLIPSPSDYQKKGLEWFNGFSLNVSIGQGDVLTTPAQIAYVLSTLVKDGQKQPLTLLRKVGMQLSKPKPRVQLPGASQNWRLVREGMEWTVSKGTSSHLLGPKFFPVRTAGKTGTAQAPMPGLGRRAGTEHSWYEGYGPLNNPNLVVVAFFENGGEGSGVALPAVRKVMAARWGVKLDASGAVLKPARAAVNRP